MLGFGLGLSHCGSKGGVADAPDFSGSAAKALAAGEANALALDFTDDHFSSTGFYGSAYILDAGTPANDYNSSPVTEAASLLTYTGSSPKLTMGPSGTLRYNAHNLLVQSEDLSTTWTKNGTPVVTATTAEDDNAAGFEYLHQSVSVTSGASYRWSLRLPKTETPQTNNWSLLRINQTADVDVVFDPSTGDYKLLAGTATITVTDGGSYYDLYIDFTADTSPIIPTIWPAVVNSATIAAATTGNYSTACVGSIAITRQHLYRSPADSTYLRTSSAARYGLPYEWSTAGVLQGIRVEPAVTNLFGYSKNIGSWVPINTDSLTVTDNQATGPDGLTSLAKVAITDTTNEVHAIYDAAHVNGLIINTNYAISAFVKDVDQQFISINLLGDTDVWATVTFDISSGAVTQEATGASGGTVTDSGVDDYGGGLYRIWMIGQISSVLGTDSVIITTNNSGTPTLSNIGRQAYAGAGTESFYFGFAQLETGSVATSPIITYGSTATRLADNISLETSAMPWADAAPGTLYVHCTDIGGIAYTRPVSFHSNTATADGVEIASTGTFANANVNSGGTATTAVPWVKGTTIKAAVGFADNDVGCSADGSTAVVDPTCTLAAGVTRLGVGSYTTVASRWFHGTIHQIAYWPRRVSDADLQTLTSTGALP